MFAIRSKPVSTCLTGIAILAASAAIPAVAAPTVGVLAEAGTPSTAGAAIETVGLHCNYHWHRGCWGHRAWRHHGWHYW